MQTARISNAACTAPIIATTVENAKKMRDSEREGYFYDGHSERSERGRETMSNRTNIDLEALYCSTAPWESILLSEATADRIYVHFMRAVSWHSFSPSPNFFEKLCRNLLTYITLSG